MLRPHPQIARNLEAIKAGVTSLGERIWKDQTCSTTPLPILEKF